MEPSPQNFWQKLETRSQSNLYFALAFLPAEEREAFRDIYRFLRAADDVADSGAPPEEIRREMARWRDELAGLYADVPLDAESHPILQRLGTTLRRFELPRAHFETILTALESDIEPRVFATLPDLETWCSEVSSTLGFLCLRILGLDSPGANAFAERLGVALQLVNVLRDVDEDAARGRVYLPQTVLARAGITRHEVLDRQYSCAYRAATGEIARRVRELFRTATEFLSPEERQRLLVPRIWADVYRAQLDLLEAQGFNVFSRQTGLRRRRKLWIAARRVLGDRLASAPAKS